MIPNFRIQGPPVTRPATGYAKHSNASNRSLKPHYYYYFLKQNLFQILACSTYINTPSNNTPTLSCVKVIRGQLRSYSLEVEPGLYALSCQKEKKKHHHSANPIFVLLHISTR